MDERLVVLKAGWDQLWICACEQTHQWESFLHIDERSVDLQSAMPTEGCHALAFDLGKNVDGVFTLVQTNLETGETNEQTISMRKHTRTTGYIGPQKMTLASTDPHAASAFCQKYLGAVHHPMSSKVAPDGGNECKTLAWVEFAHTKIRQHIPTQYRAQHIESFHLHFVKHQHRPSGSLSIHDFETALLHAHRNFTVWDAWMDYRLTMEASSLNSLVTQLAVAGLPFLARQNADGTASVVTAIPHAAMVLELVTPQLELLVLTQWNRCREAPQLVWTDAGRRQVAAARQGMEVPPQLRLWPRRFVFPTSSHAKAAARFVTSYFEAEPVF